MDKGASLRDRAGGLRPEPVPVSAVPALIPSAAKCDRCNGTGRVYGMMEDEWGVSCGSWPCERGCKR